MVTVVKGNFFELLQARRSVRVYADRPIREDQLQSILGAARSAPSAGNLQAYEIMVVTDMATKQRLVQASLQQQFIAQAPVVLAFLAHPERSAARYRRRGSELYSVQDATIACAYAQLAATALGLGSVWVGAFDEAAVVAALEAEPVWRPIALLPLGYAAESPPPTPRRHLNDLVHR
jgi:nitroreductase